MGEYIAVRVEDDETVEIDIGLRIEVLHCNLHLVADKVVVHVADAFICIWIRIKKGHLITIVVIVANQDIIEVHVQGYNPLITISFAEMDQLPGPIDHGVLYAQEGHRSQLVYSGQETEVLKCWEHHRSLGGWPVDPRIMWHRRRDYIIPLDEDTVGIGRVEYISWYWSITKRYIGRPGFTYDMRYEPRDHIERSLVQRIDSSTSDVGPSEPCAGTPQQPDDAGPPQFSPDVMTFSQHGLYDVGASQILTDEGMPDTQPPQSTVGTYRRQRHHRGSTSTLPQQSEFDLLGETLGSILEDMDSEIAQSESCDAILVHDTQSQSETEVDAQDEIQEQCHNRGRGRGRASRKGKKRCSLSKAVDRSMARTVDRHREVGIAIADFCIGNENADSKVGLGNADFRVDVANADFRVGIANADSKVAICNADSEAGIAYADSVLVSSLPITKLPT
ncbi:hypothetical protein Taro_036453 [Colocasia esculenta]|uniref:Uncharacterized protein n=1 Tax=Colocasia esculenta TaxID=4460 RepID=A0A843W6V0_COLES|nr:hypothetical protein [Colocasia esculenta]